HLRRGADLAGRLLDEVGIELIGLVGTQHVVIAGDDAQVQRLVAGQRRLFGRRAGGKGMGEVAAAEHRAMHTGLARGIEPVEVVTAAVAAARGDAISDILDGLTDGHIELLLFRGRAPWAGKWLALSGERSGSGAA